MAYRLLLFQNHQSVLVHLWTKFSDLNWIHNRARKIDVKLLGLFQSYTVRQPKKLQRGRIVTLCVLVHKSTAIFLGLGSPTSQYGIMVSKWFAIHNRGKGIYVWNIQINLFRVSKPTSYFKCFTPDCLGCSRNFGSTPKYLTQCNFSK